jgi:hypothetical protein
VRESHEAACASRATEVPTVPDVDLAVWAAAGVRPSVVVDGRGVALTLTAPEARHLAEALQVHAEQVQHLDLRPAPALPSWLTDPCPSWCDWQSDHKERDEPADRRHYSREYRRELSLEAPVLECDEHQPEHVAVYAQQHYREVEAQVIVTKGEGSLLTLTIEEAEELGALVTALVEEVRRG